MDKDSSICLPVVEFSPIITDRPKVLSISSKKEHFFDQCYTFKRIFDKKHSVGEILFQEGYTSINNLRFPKHDLRGKATMMAFDREMEIKMLAQAFFGSYY